MNTVMRVLFWLSLAGLSLALVAPIVNSGATSWAEAQVGVILGIVSTLGFGAGALASLRARGNESGYETAVRRRKTGIAFSIAAIVVMAGIGGIGEAVAQDGWRSDDVTPSYGSGGYGTPVYREPSARDLAISSDYATGTWSCLYAILAGGIPFVAMVYFLAKKPARGAMFAPQVYGYGHDYGYGYEYGGQHRAWQAFGPAQMPSSVPSSRAT